MSNTTDAHDPSVADYRDTSPRFAQGGKGQMRLPYVIGGGARVLRGRRGQSRNIAVAPDPSVSVRR